MTAFCDDGGPAYVVCVCVCLCVWGGGYRKPETEVCEILKYISKRNYGFFYGILEESGGIAAVL